MPAAQLEHCRYLARPPVGFGHIGKQSGHCCHIAGIADRAGVTRLTVYRHFPDEDALFGACSAHWLSRQQLPDPGAWSQIGDPAARLRAGLADLYRFYRAGAGMLTHIYRDFAALPEAHQQRRLDGDSYVRDVLTAPFGGTED